jgi:hypothetical protein
MAEADEVKDTPLTADEIRDLLTEGQNYDEPDEATKAYRTATTIETGAAPVLCPISLYTNDGREFHTNGLNTVTYTQVGLYLVVYERGKEDEAKHIVVPWQQVSYAELKFELMRELAEELNEDSGD